MLIQKQPNNWSCLPTAFASVLGVPVADIIEATGHEGDTIMWPDLAPPRCYRSWHIQELVKVALTYGYAVTTIERVLSSTPAKEVKELVQYDTKYFKDTLLTATGIVSAISFTGCYHALVFEKGKYYDPRRGEETNLKCYELGEILWRFDAITTRS